MVYPAKFIGECWDKKHATFMIMGRISAPAPAPSANVGDRHLPNALDRTEPEQVGRGGPPRWVSTTSSSLRWIATIWTMAARSIFCRGDRGAGIRQATTWYDDRDP